MKSKKQWKLKPLAAPIDEGEGSEEEKDKEPDKDLEKDTSEAAQTAK